MSLSTKEKRKASRDATQERRKTQTLKSPVERGGALVEDLTSGIDMFDTKSGPLKQETRRLKIV